MVLELWPSICQNESFDIYVYNYLNTESLIEWGFITIIIIIILIFIIIIIIIITKHLNKVSSPLKKIVITS